MQQTKQHVQIDIALKQIHVADPAVKLSFEGRSASFYFLSIAVVAKEMKAVANSEDPMPFIEFARIGERLRVFAARAGIPSDSAEKLANRLYSTWRSRLDPAHRSCTYSVLGRLPQGREPVITKLFETKPGRAGLNAAFRIGLPVECLAIANEEKLDEYLSDSHRSAQLGGQRWPSTMQPPEDSDDKQKAQWFVDRIWEVASPDTYCDDIRKSTAVAQELLASRLSVHEDSALNSALAFTQFFEAYIERLGIIGVSSVKLLATWMEETVDDPWWRLWHQPDPEGGSYSQWYDVASPRILLSYAWGMGHLLHVLSIFQLMYLVSVVSFERDRLMQILREQPVAVQEQVFALWSKRLFKDDERRTEIVGKQAEFFKKVQELLMWQHRNIRIETLGLKKRDFAF